MSRRIRLTENEIEAALKEVNDSLRSAKSECGKIEYVLNLDKVDETATLFFYPEAYIKMMALVNDFSTEVAWRGEAYKEDRGVFVIKDIMVYPQIVTGTTVETDTDLYGEWSENLDLEQFKNMRMQGHSHVNMGTSPSGTDTKGDQDTIDTLREDDFYIFLIWNKKDEHNVRIYDIGENIMYENKDIDVKFIGVDIDSFLAEANGLVSSRSYVTTATTALAAKNGTSKSTSKKASKKSTKGTGKNKPSSWNNMVVVEDDDDEWESIMEGYRGRGYCDYEYRDRYGYGYSYM